VGKRIIRMLLTVFMILGMIAGFIYRLVDLSFRVGKRKAEDFIEWI